MNDRAGLVPLPYDGASAAIILRLVSLILAGTLLVFVVASPEFLQHGPTMLRVMTPVMALGVAGALFYAAGYRPRSQIAATMLGPWVSWPLIVSSIALLAFQSA